MTSEQALLQAIIENPHEDAPRMIHADWLEENGQPERAELIRVQCELALFPEWERQAALLRLRERALLLRWEHRWRAELPMVKGVRWGSFQRGFVAEVIVTDPAVLVEQEESLRAVAPVERVAFATWPTAEQLKKVRPLPWLRGLAFREQHDAQGAQHLERVLNSPLVEGMRSLDLQGMGLENPGAGVLAGATHLKDLQELNLSENYIGVHGAQALAGVKHLSSLRILKLSSYGSGYVEDPFLGDEGVVALASSPYLANLHTLELGGNRLSARSFQHLLQSRYLTRLERVVAREAHLSEKAFPPQAGPALWRDLDLTYSELDERALRALASCPRLAGLARLRLSGYYGPTTMNWATLVAAPTSATLRVLDLEGCTLGPDGIHTLAQRDWPHLHTLHLGRTGLQSEGAMHLAEARGLSQLIELSLKDNQMGTAGVQALVRSPWFGELRVLWLDGNDLGAPAVAALTEGAGPELRKLTLSNNSLEAAGASALANATWPALCELGLENTKLGDQGARALTQASGLRKLAILKLDNCGLTGAGLRALTSSTQLAGLVELSLNYNQLGREGAQALAQAQHWPLLKTLQMVACGFQKNDLTEFADSELLRQLRRLEYWGSPVAPAIQKKIAQHLEAVTQGPQSNWDDEEDSIPS